MVGKIFLFLRFPPAALDDPGLPLRKLVHEREKRVLFLVVEHVGAEESAEKEGIEGER